jgi:hypothetical protein
MSIIAANDLCWHYHEKNQAVQMEYFKQVYQHLRNFAFDQVKGKDAEALYQAID